jgi:hypothetical protein
MGFEQEMSFTPPLQDSTLECLLTCVKSPPTWPLVRAEQAGETHVLRYALAAAGPLHWEEDFLIDLSNRRLYVLLHAATGEQEQAVLGWLQGCLHNNGLFGLEFQEP